MTIDCAQAQRLLHGGSLIRTCEVVRSRALAGGGDILRIQSAFRYPGGEYVDLFLHATVNAEAELSDDGFTMGQLLSMNVDPDATQRRKDFIQSVCDDLKVRRRGGEFLALLGRNPETALADAAIRLGQACVRIADLSLTHRTRLVSPFSDELEEGLESIGRPFRRGVPLAGRAGRVVEIDYVVIGQSRRSAILTMTARNPARAHDVAIETFTKWFDLQEHQTDFQFISVLDEKSANSFREPDLERLELYSNVVSYPGEADLLRDIVIA